MKTRNWIYILILLAIVLLGFNMRGAYKKQTAVRPVPCIIPDVPLQQHLHPTLQIVVDGKLEAVPADIGTTKACHLALHTHDAMGTVHVEAQDVYPYSLGDFFRVWQQPLERNGYTLTIFVDAQEYKGSAEKLVFKDKQQIILSYVHTP